MNSNDVIEMYDRDALIAELVKKANAALDLLEERTPSLRLMTEEDLEIASEEDVSLHIFEVAMNEYLPPDEGVIALIELLYDLNGDHR